MESLPGYDAWLEEPYQMEHDDEDRENKEIMRENIEFDKGWDSYREEI